MNEIFRYNTTNGAKAVALFASLVAAGHSTQLTSLFCKEHGLEGYGLDTLATPEEFATVRESLYATFPSSSPVPDTIPDSWLN